MPSDDKLTLEYYDDQARHCGDHWSSTMQDEVVRTKEIEFITHALHSHANKFNGDINVLDLGCGNGYATEVISRTFPKARFWGGDFCNGLLCIAKARNLKNCQFCNCDARKLQFEDGLFDFVYTERCLINIRDWEEQKVALSEVARVTKTGGIYTMIECFTDGHDNYNKARTELGLPEVPLPGVNLFFNKANTMIELQKYFKGKNAPMPYNFLSTHYFVARVLHACVQHNEVRNSEFVKFFTEVLPNAGNYSPIQGFCWEKE